MLVAVGFLVVFHAFARTRALQLLRGAITRAILGLDNWCRPSSEKRVRPADTGRWPAGRFPWEAEMRNKWC